MSSSLPSTERYVTAAGAVSPKPNTNCTFETASDVQTWVHGKHCFCTQRLWICKATLHQKLDAENFISNIGVSAF